MEYNGLIFSKVGQYYGVGNISNTYGHGNGVVGGVNAEGDFIIPKRVEGILVTQILDYAFRECNKITSIKIEAPIKIIKRWRR